MVRGCAVAMVVVFALAGCSQDPLPSDSGVSIAPSDRVTDAAAVAITDEQAERIRDACGDAADLPEPGSPCWDAVEDVEPPGDDTPRPEPNCAEEVCLVGTLAESPGVVTVRIEDPRPGSPACQGSRVCQGFEVPAPLGARVLEAEATDPTPEPTAPDTTDPEPTEPTEPEPEPTEPEQTPVEPTDQVEPTGAPLST